MADVRLVLSMLLRVAASLALTANIARADSQVAGNSWRDMYRDLEDNFYSNERVAEKIRAIVEKFEAAGEDEQKREEIELLQRATLINQRSCDKRLLLKLMQLTKRYEISIDGRKNHLAIYVKHQADKLFFACRSHDFEVLRAELEDNDDAKGLRKVTQLAEFVNLGDTDGYSTSHRYSVEDLRLGVTKYLTTRYANGKPVIQKSSNPIDLITKRKKFDKLYEKYVLNPCRSWIKATEELWSWTNLAGYQPHDEQLFSENEVARWLPIRNLCKFITDDQRTKELKKLAYQSVHAS